MSEGRVRPLFDAMAEDVTWRWMGVKQWTRSFNGKQTVVATAAHTPNSSSMAGAWHARAAGATMRGWLVMTAGRRCS